MDVRFNLLIKEMLKSRLRSKASGKNLLQQSNRPANKPVDHAGTLCYLPLATGGDGQSVLAEFTKAGINWGALAAQLQDEGVKSFVSSWNELMGVIAAKSEAIR